METFELLSFIKPTENETFSFYDPLRIKLHNVLRVDFSQLNEQEIRNKCANKLN